jgi:hypothetical protein
MKKTLALFCLGLAANASAADPPSAPSLQVQPLAPSALLKTANSIAKPVAMHRVPAPSINETSVTRRPDGTLVLNCVQKPNPKLAQQMAAQQDAARSVEPQQP